VLTRPRTLAPGAVVVGEELPGATAEASMLPCQGRATCKELCTAPRNNPTECSQTCTTSRMAVDMRRRRSPLDTVFPRKVG
jgi:hypothetical protein